MLPETSRSAIPTVPNPRLFSPQDWAGEADCLIGPFDSREAARTFASLEVDFRAGALLERFVARGGGWYLELTRLEL